MDANATLIYDGECPLCLKAVKWVQLHARPGAIECMACQSHERSERFPSMPTEQCMEAMQLVLPNGRTFGGEEALPHLFMLMRRWRWMAHFFRLPIVSHLAPYAYAFVARRRHMISILVARKERDALAACGPEGRSGGNGPDNSKD